MNEQLKEKIGQSLVIRFQGPDLTNETKEFIEEYNIGGVCLYGSNCKSLEQILELTNALSEIRTRQPLLISIDHEGGRVFNNLPTPFTHFPSAEKVGAAYVKDPSINWGYEVGKAMAKELGSVGIHLNFAPVLDIWTNPLNKIIENRSYGNIPDLVSNLGIQMIKGLQDHGVAACGKHFPGHGDTSFDSHKVEQTLPHNEARLSRFEMVPFKAAIKAGVACIMTAHVIYDGLDKKMPATLSVKIIRDLLKGQLGFKGLVISDDLTMKGITNLYPKEEAALMAYQAGSHLLLLGFGPQSGASTIERFHQAIDKEQISEVFLQATYNKLICFKESFVNQKNPSTIHWIGCGEHAGLKERILQVVT